MPDRTDDIAALAYDLVSIPSHEDEAEAARFVADWLRERTDGEVVLDDHDNVVARRGEGTSLALVGHHDVVPPDERQVVDGEYVVERRDGRLYGRGSADMKGSLAAAMWAFVDAEPAGELIFASFAGEETGGVGCRAAIEAGFAPDYALVAEGSTNYSGEDVTDVVVAHRGRRGSTVTARGKSAHASVPEAGVNAIYRAADAVDVIRDLAVPDAAVLDNRVTGSVAVTGIEGGSAWNVVPERCEITVDERTVPGGYADLSRVESVEGVTWAVDQDLPPMACEDEAYVEAVLEAARDAQGGSPELTTKPHATDAGWLALAGVECVVCGASEPGQAHTETESVSLAVLARCYRIYRNVAERLD